MEKPSNFCESFEKLKAECVEESLKKGGDATQFLTERVFKDLILFCVPKRKYLPQTDFKSIITEYLAMDKIPKKPGTQRVALPKPDTQANDEAQVVLSKSESLLIEGEVPMTEPAVVKPKKLRILCNEKLFKSSSAMPTPPNPPRRLPESIRNRINGMRITREVLVIRKTLFDSDVKPGHCKISMPVSQTNPDFSREVERESLNQEKAAVDVLFIEPSNTVKTMILVKWNMRKNSIYALRKYWNVIVRNNKLKKGNVVEVWSFRIGAQEQLCMALDVPNGGEERSKSSGSSNDINEGRSNSNQRIEGAHSNGCSFSGGDAGSTTNQKCVEESLKKGGDATQLLTKRVLKDFILFSSTKRRPLLQKDFNNGSKSECFTFTTENTPKKPRTQRSPKPDTNANGREIQQHDGEEYEDSSSSMSMEDSVSSYDVGFGASSSGSQENNESRSKIGLTERLTDILVDEGDGDLLLQHSDREDHVLQWLQALDLQVMGACRNDERLKPLLKMDASNGVAEDRLLAHLSQVCCINGSTKS
ncbi:hypothetical protein SO802_029061 [Lithocarpus litseifolius]|uniref:B3 domain-containing protein n=1 Tax=Lithocarpus litseifolius TaxID=425828 RepID=A0AAW2BU87_9ROSI